ncbi:acyltransferase [Diplodia corticola]|uniref:Acyltransferase n=1 Tax=Diplodia corticola TaxID=236234 RepID=A0A1J9S757_9PEZI|nr:acyltransferase [Diplodia corticola]OJD40787.1 acyltransferase [Diplodia corticola]
MYGGYQRVPSGTSDCGTDVFLPSSPGRSSTGSEASLNEKQSTATTTAELFGRSYADVSVKLRAYARSRGRWLYDVSRCVGGSALAPILPSFLRPRVLGEGGSAGSATTHHVNGIATLDGVRGYACFFVFNFHFLFMYTLTSVRGFGVDPTNFSNRWIHQLPFIKLLYSGRSMVCVFFVLSGYVLSRKPLMALRSQSYDSMLQALSSSIFRRGIRLFLPTIFSTFLVMLAIQAGWFEWATEIGNDGVTLAFLEHHPMTLETWQDQMWDYLNFVRNYIDFTNWGEWYNLYDPHVWTIPLEYRASMVLFLNLICLSRARTAWRLALTVAFIIFCTRWGRFEVVLFLAGSLLAELDLITNTWGPAAPPVQHRRQPSLLPTSTNPTTPPLLTTIETAAPPPPSPAVFCPHPTKPAHPLPLAFFHLTTFTAGLYLLSFPDEYGDYTPGYTYLSLHIPDIYRESCPYRFWQSAGAILTLHAICNSRALRRPFQTPVAQYLGKISYAFYLVHGPVLHSLGFVVMRLVFGVAGRYGYEEVVVGQGVEGEDLFWDPVPREPVLRVVENGEMGNRRFVACLAVGYVVLLAVSVWLADLFWRMVDTPVVRLARAVENRVKRRD